MKKNIYLEAKITGYYKHIKNIDKTLFSSFWELMETVNYNFKVTNNVYIQIIDMLIINGYVIVGDYCITIDNNNANNLELLRKTKKQILSRL